MDSISAAKVRIFDLDRQANGIKQQMQQHQFALQQIEQQQQREYIQLDILERAEAARQAETAKKAAEAAEEGKATDSLNQVPVAQ